MMGNRGYWGATLVLMLGLLIPGTALAGPFFGDWGWLWHPDRDCPQGAYSPLHYWAPTAYRARAFVHPSKLDQYPPGPSPSVPPSYLFQKSGCRTLPPMPSAPYADPSGYYGREVVPGRE